jgi:hypothetical protein
MSNSDAFPLAGRVNVLQTAGLAAVFVVVGLGLQYFAFDRTAAFMWVGALFVFLAIPAQWCYDIERGGGQRPVPVSRSSSKRGSSFSVSASA